MRKCNPHTLLALLIVAIVFFGSTYVMAQTEKSNSDALARLDLEQISYGLESPAALPINEANEIFIQQIGIDNKSDVTTTTHSSEIILNQNGSNNTAILDINAKTYVSNLVQKGSANLFIENTNSPTLNLQRNVGQEGSNHSVLIYGSNTLTQNIRLTMQGTPKTIMIRNFK